MLTVKDIQLCRISAALVNDLETIKNNLVSIMDGFTDGHDPAAMAKRNARREMAKAAIVCDHFRVILQNFSTTAAKFAENCGKGDLIRSEINDIAYFFGLNEA